MTSDAARVSTRSALHVSAARWLLPASALLCLVWVGANDGGYFPFTWGWLGVALAWLAALWLAFAREARLRPLEIVSVAALTLFVGWVALSYTWSLTPADTVAEVQRALVYPLALLFVLLSFRRRDVSALLGASAVAITLLASYGLATRLFPERLGSFDSISAYRLSEPVGYWNALGIVIAVGIILTLGFAAGARPWRRPIAAVGLVLLAPTLYFTYSRGAFIALAIGLGVLAVTHRERLRVSLTVLVLAPFAAAAVWLASRSDALTTVGAPVGDATREGHHLGLWILTLAAGAAVALASLALVETRWTPGRRVQVAYGGLLAFALVVGVVAAIARYGGPATMVEDAYDAFRGPPVGTSLAGSNLNRRIFNLSGNGRALTWEAAWDDYRDHRLLGSGAGSFETYWNEHRPLDLKVRDAHSLYVEVLAELGPVGLALLLLALLTPLVAVVRARRNTLVPVAAAAYVAWLAHLGADWDWEMPIVMLAGLTCGAALLLYARGVPPRPLPSAVRFGALAAVLAVGIFAFVGLIGNSAYEKAETAQEDNHLAVAEHEARKAARWAPWSAEPWKLLADIEASRNPAEARRSIREAIDREPYDYQAWYQLARLTKGAEQRHALAEARRLNPRSRSVQALDTQLRGTAAGG